jgi:curved DNA-binding protein CbpA
MKFKNFIELLKEMSLPDAVKIFGIPPDKIGDQEYLKKTYRELALNNHPDRGGSLDMMKNINAAYDVLKKSKIEQVSTASNMSYKEREEIKYRYATMIKTSLMSSYRPDLFMKHFYELSGKTYEHKITAEYPRPNAYNFSQYGGFNAEFFTPDRSIVFTLQVTGNTDDLMGKVKLGAADVSFSCSIVTFGLTFNKKQKMSKRDWQWSSNHAFLNNPEVLYPTAKLKAIFSGKTSARQFKKRDMETFLKLKLKAINHGDDYWYMPIWNTKDIDMKNPDSYFLCLYRMVFIRQGTWGINAIYKGRKSFGRMLFVTMPETEKTAEYFHDIQIGTKLAKDENHLISIINNYMKDVKEKKINLGDMADFYMKDII